MQYRFGPFNLDDEAFELSAEGRIVTLEPKALQLLLYCVQHPNRVLRKQELLNQLWSDATVGENALTRCVAQVRKALDDDSRVPEYIATVPTVGYRFIAEVAVAEVISSLAASASGTAANAGGPSVPLNGTGEIEPKAPIASSRSPLMAALIAVGVLLLAAVGWLGWQRYEDHVGGPPLQVVVADFDGGTGDPVLDRTLQDVLRVELLQSPFVSVVAPGAIRDLMTQMRHDPSERLTVELARDICERTASQAVLHGTLSRLGNRFLIVEEATSCADNTIIGTAKQDVGVIDDLPAAVGKVAAALRHDMGESRRMVARFNRPLSPENTSSLEALKAFSQASYLNNLGKHIEAVDLLKRAVALDPKFAAAYFNLWAFSFTTMEVAERQSYLQKAYDLRDFATEPTHFAITAYYEGVVAGDLDGLQRTFETWANVYPRDAEAWRGLTEVAGFLGRYPESVAAAKRALELDPNNSLSLYELAHAQMHNEDFQGARKTCDMALAKGFDTELIRTSLLYLGHVTHDAALVAQQEQWAQAHPPSPGILLNDAYIALTEGRASAADALFLRAEEGYRQQGNAALGLQYRQGSARAYFEVGWPDKARAQLNIAPIPTNAFSLSDDLVALAETGKPDLAESMLQKQLADHPQSTRWHRSYGPQLHAVIALLEHKPADVLAITAPENVIEAYKVAYPRGLALMELNRFPEAEAQFHILVDHPGVDPISTESTAAQLQLARVLAKEGRRDDAIRQYGVFLTLWKDADKDSSTLKAAQAELSAMHPKGYEREAGSMPRPFFGRTCGWPLLPILLKFFIRLGLASY